jgi:hypothetical protein
MKKTTIILAVGLAVLLMAPGASRTQDLRALQGLPGTQALSSGCYFIYSLTYGVLYSDVVYVNIGPQGIITGYDDVTCQFPVSGKKTGSDFVVFFDLPYESCLYDAVYAMGVGTGLRCWAYAFDEFGDPMPPEHLQFIPCSMLDHAVSSGVYFGQTQK